MKRILKYLLSFTLLLGIVGCSETVKGPLSNEENIAITIPSYEGQSYVEINQNIPFFKESDLTTEPFEMYSELDELGRAQSAYANICQEIMPTTKRESIGMIKPSGWHTTRYDEIVDGKYLYNRCHLIGYQLAGENANEKNLITGTRYMNVEGMLPFENLVDDFVEETNYHVLYRVTPVYTGDNLVADGVLMEAKSVEDQGKGLQFNVFVYNIQPQIHINYATGESEQGQEGVTPGNIPTLLEKEAWTQEGDEIQVWIAGSGKGTKYHAEATCGNLKDPISLTLQEALNQGYEPCKKCH